MQCHFRRVAEQIKSTISYDTIVWDIFCKTEQLMVMVNGDSNSVPT